MDKEQLRTLFGEMEISEEDEVIRSRITKLWNATAEIADDMIAGSDTIEQGMEKLEMFLQVLFVGMQIRARLPEKQRKAMDDV
ncbi:hypothetical protein IH575_04785 [Candidatus Dojkabacteria bacterium]|nr:hypothetical protein [Candidatus Dojkabacteria bacterium]